MDTASQAERPSPTQVEGDGTPVPLSTALPAIARCVVVTARLLAGRRIRQPRRHVGDLVTFADGSSAHVYRETVALRGVTADPVALVVEFRLRWIRGRGHAAFRVESLLNTPLFVGFPGFVSKLWLTHDEQGRYRGVYEWDGGQRAHAYARTLWWILALVSERGSIHYAVVPSCTRTELTSGLPLDDETWWRVTKMEAT